VFNHKREKAVQNVGNMANRSGSSKRVLVVDDEAKDRDHICNVLRPEGYSVYATGSYSGAVNILARHPGEIGLLITDMSLPEKNGFELYANLLKCEPGLKVLFVSGPTGAEVSKFYHMGFPNRNYLEKPFGAAELITRVRSLMESEPLAHNSGAS
jgi:two-component system, cell cycle sensor histidine kinase and response regulator CckA